MTSSLRVYVLDSPSSSVTVKVIVYDPPFEYSWEIDFSLDLVPSPRSQLLDVMFPSKSIDAS